MESITINFSRTRDETEKAWLTFLAFSKAGKFLNRFGFPVASIIIFIVLLHQSQPYTGNELLIYEKSYSVISFLSYLSMPVLFSLVLGWFLNALIKTIRNNKVIMGLRKILPESFGETTITLEQSGLTVQAPLSQRKYDWKLLDSILVTPEYLFICSGKGVVQSLVAWMPANTSDVQPEKIISSAEQWLSKSK